MPAILNTIRNTTRILQRLLFIKARNSHRVRRRTRLLRRRGVELTILGRNVRSGEEGETSIDARRDAGRG